MARIVQRIAFQSDGLKLIGYMYSPDKNNTYPGVLFIHGSAKDNPNNIFDSWQKYLCEEGFASFSFFTRGVAESEGKYIDSSLHNRLTDAQNALDAFIATGRVDKDKIAALSNSMGGHIAAKLSLDPRIQAIILYAAAAYNQDAEYKLLDESFTQVLRRPNSWEESPAFESLKQAQKPALIIYPQNDTVIPQGVKNAYRIVVRADNYLEIPEATHATIAENSDKDREIMQKTFQISSQFFKTNLK